VGVNGGRGEKILGASNIEFMMLESYKSALARAIEILTNDLEIQLYTDTLYHIFTVYSKICRDPIPILIHIQK